MVKQELHPSQSSDRVVTSLSHIHDCSPALLSCASGPSVPSASSSSIGSPFSDPQQVQITQDYFGIDGTYATGYFPAIVNHDGFGPDMIAHGVDAEMTLSGHEKVSGEYVGESASLSFPQLRTSVERASATKPSCCWAGVSITPPSPIDAAADTPMGAVGTTFQFPIPTSTSSRQALSKPPSVPASSWTPPNNVRMPLASPKTAAFQPSPPQTLASLRYLPYDADHLHSPFFARSSGNFVPPLESSCLFLLRLCLLSFLSSFLSSR